MATKHPIPMTWDEAIKHVMEEYKEAWRALSGTDDIERWKRMARYELRASAERKEMGGYTVEYRGGSKE